MFELWRQEIERAPTVRTVEGGQIALDTVPSVRGAVHQMNGSLVQVWYKAANPATAQAISEARRATVDFGLPRQLYTGRLIDILRGGTDGTVYFKVKAIEREGAGFRSFNPSKGQLLEMVINPSAAQLLSRVPPAELVTPAPAQIVSPTLAERIALERQIIDRNNRED